MPDTDFTRDGGAAPIEIFGNYGTHEDATFPREWDVGTLPNNVSVQVTLPAAFPSLEAGGIYQLRVANTADTDSLYMRFGPAGSTPVASLLNDPVYPIGRENVWTFTAREGQVELAVLLNGGNRPYTIVRLR